MDYETVPFEAFSPQDRYKFICATVVPRPIALVTSTSERGAVNAAPFSQFIILSSTPIILGIVAGRYADDSFKDTQNNILRNGEYVINTVSEEMAEITQLCAFPFVEAESEPQVLGLETASSRVVATPRLALAPVAFECRLSRTERFGSTATLIAGEVVAIQARPGLVSGHRVDHSGLNPLGRIAGRSYCRTNEVLTMPSEIDAPYKARRRAGS